MGRRLFLHVGLPKTGTSAVQAWLHGNSELLAGFGIDYPAPLASPGDPSHRWLVPGLVSNDLDRLATVLARAAQPDVVLSSEGLTNHLHDFSSEALGAFRAVTGEFEVTVLLATRDVDAWLRSYYRQSIINPGNRMSELWGTKLSYEDFVRHPRMRRLLDHSALIEDLKPAYGGRQVIRLDYDGDWFADMLRALGVDAPACAPARRVNETVGEWVAALMLRINRLGTGEAERRLWRAAIEMHSPTGNSVFRQALPGVEQGDIAALDTAIVDEEVRARILAGETDIDGLRGFSDFLKARSR